MVFSILYLTRSNVIGTLADNQEMVFIARSEGNGLIRGGLSLP